MGRAGLKEDYNNPYHIPTLLEISDPNKSQRYET